MKGKWGDKVLRCNVWLAQIRISIPENILICTRMWNGTIIWNGTISKYVLIRMGDRGAYFLFSVYSYNPHDTDFDGSWMLWNTLFKIQRRYVRIVLWLRIQQCTRCCFAHLGRRRGRYFLSGWSLMSLTRYTAPLSGLLCALLRVGFADFCEAIICKKERVEWERQALKELF